MSNLKEASKDNYDSTEGNSFTALNTGCLQRIADATELMAKDRIKMEHDIKFYKERYEYYRAQYSISVNSISALRGWITRLKNKSKK